MMLWYQQKVDKLKVDNPSLDLIGFTYGTSPPTYEKQFKEHFTITREETTRGTLIVDSAKLFHTAVYFCAASTQWCGVMRLPHLKPRSLPVSVT